jgi:hypothetical protein
MLYGKRKVFTGGFASVERVLASSYPVYRFHIRNKYTGVLHTHSNKTPGIHLGLLEHVTLHLDQQSAALATKGSISPGKRSSKQIRVGFVLERKVKFALSSGASKLAGLTKVTAMYTRLTRWHVHSADGTFSTKTAIAPVRDNNKRGGYVPTPRPS